MSGCRMWTKLIVGGLVVCGCSAVEAGLHYDRYFNHYADSFVTKIFMKSKGTTKATTTLDQCRELIRSTYELSGGMHQIIYLVGWQHDGHDSKYPDWGTVGAQCKSSLSDDPLTSLRMAMREARERWNCDLSLHLNMNDAHPDSPLWQLYNEKDLLCRDKAGKIRPLGTWFRISHVKEWKSGYAKKRIDALVAMLPELKDAKTVHIDAFFAQDSEFDGITIADDADAIRAITDYWHSLGIDVTNEFITDESMMGYFPMVYHFNLDERQRLLYPADVVCGGDNLWNGRLYLDYHHRYKPNMGELFCTPKAGCLYDEAWGIGAFCDMHPGFLNRAALAERLFHTAFLAAWYNRRPVTRHTMTATDYAVERDGGVKANVRMKDRHLTVTEKGRTVVDGHDFFLDMPYGGGTVLAFSGKGCDRVFELPSRLAGAHQLVGTRYPKGEPCTLAVTDGKVQVKLAPCESLMLKPQ